MQRTVLLFTVLGTLALAACNSSPVTKGELIGVWKANSPDAEDSLEIHNDGTYLHTYSTSGTAPFINHGTWELEPIDSDGEQRISLDNFQFVNKAGKADPPGVFPPIVERAWNGIVIDLDSDENQYYSKAQ